MKSMTKKSSTNHVSVIQNADFGQSLREEWPKYGLLSNNLHFKGDKIPYQVVIRDGKLISIFSDRYQVLPNEDAVTIGHSLAAEYGLVPAEEGPKEFGNGKIKSVTYNGDKTAVSTIYINPRPTNVAGVGEKADNIYSGVAFRNSINGWSAFTASVFTFRQVCENRAYHYAKKASLSISVEEGISTRGDAIASLRLQHTKQLKDMGFLKTKLKSVLDAGNDILFRYKVMKREKLLKFQAEALARRMPKVVVNSELISKWLHIDTNTKTGAKKISFDNEITVWKAYNDITDVLSHTNKLNFETTAGCYTLADSLLVRKRGQ